MRCTGRYGALWGSVFRVSVCGGVVFRASWPLGCKSVQDHVTLCQWRARARLQSLKCSCSCASHRRTCMRSATALRCRKVIRARMCYGCQHRLFIYKTSIDTHDGSPNSGQRHQVRPDVRLALAREFHMNPAGIAKHHLIHGRADPRSNVNAVQNVPIQTFRQCNAPILRHTLLSLLQSASHRTSIDLEACTRTHALLPSVRRQI